MTFLASLLLVCGALAFAGCPLAAALVWVLGSRWLHAAQEIEGNLARYFGQLVGSRYLQRFSGFENAVLVALPAAALQTHGAWKAFGGEHLDGAWMAFVIAAGWSDALLSHLGPLLQGRRDEQPGAHELNPGATTAGVFLVDGALLLGIWHAPILADPRSIGLAALGAGFFALVRLGLPLVREAKG